jgi:hypothetical protein
MRYAILEVLPPEVRPGEARVTVAYRNLSQASANDARAAWNYQLARKGGWMEVVREDEIEARIASIKEHAFKFSYGA